MALFCSHGWEGLEPLPCPSEASDVWGKANKVGYVFQALGSGLCLLPPPPPSPLHPNTPWKGPQLVPRFPEEEWGLHILEVEATTPVIGYRGEGST